jgi:hypothetical protein
MANVKISALPVYTGTPADLRWFVMNNSGETTTFKYSGYSSPLRYAYSQFSYQNAWDTGTRVASDYQVVIGGDNASSISTTSSPYCGLFNSVGCQITTKHNGKGYGTTIVGSLNSTIGGSSDAVANFLPGIYTSIEGENNAYCSAIIGAGQSKMRYGGDNNNGVQYSFLGGGRNNTIGGLALESALLGGYNNTLQQYRSAMIGGQDNTIGDIGTSVGSAYRWSSIIGGSGNTLSRGSNCSIINSTNSTQNSAGVYETNTVSMVGCVNTDITNATNSVLLGLSGRTIAGGSASNTTFVEKFYVFGNTSYEATTVNDPGTINIDIFNQSHVEINASGGTYDLVISPSPNTVGTPELTLLINYISSGATITFNNAGNTQWRWSSGTPTFSAGTRSIIKVAAWAGNDVWEVSRSMNMS